MLVPFKYDLGGRVVRHDLSETILAAECEAGTLTEDPALTRSWNLSYLGRQAVVLSGNLPGGRATFAGVEWDYARRLRLYPWLGVISIDYRFETTAEVDMATFYDDLVDWKNDDYLWHLDQLGELTSALDVHTRAHREQRPSVDLHRGIVQRLRTRFREREVLESRLGIYHFHDFRTCFVVDAGVEAAKVDSLLLLNRSQRARDRRGAPVEGFSTLVPPTYAGDVVAASTGWATVVRASDTHSQDFMSLVSIFDLIHAQWFLCQVWINVADRFLRSPADGSAPKLSTLRESERHLARDLADVGDLGLMLKDPELVEVARYFARAFEIEIHQRAAETRMKLLDEAADEIEQVQRTASTDRLQVLFALSAAGSLGALIPAFIDVDPAPWAYVLTIGTILVLWWVFSSGPAGLRSQGTWAARRIMTLGRRPLPRSDTTEESGDGA